MNRILIAATLLAGLASCHSNQETPDRLKTGTWRATFEIQEQELPFNFELANDKDGGYDLYLINAEERLLLDEVAVTGDSVDISLHVFDANIKARLKGDTLEGYFINNYTTNYRIPFRAVYGQDYRFAKNNSQDNLPDFSGKYQVYFFQGTDTTLAVGIFKQQGSRVTGTFLTPTGDYRYLQGDIVNDTMHLSTFDGNHIYLFRAARQGDGMLSGVFFSGKTRKRSWIAVKNENAALPDPESLTYLKKGYDRITFTFPDPDREPLSLEDEKYRDKVVILQLFGTWCPNCMDETKFLASWYRNNRHRGVEIIGLAYERKDDFAYASSRVKKMIEKWGVEYDIAIAGTDNKEAASKTLPMLNAILAFPTTIFIGKDGQVKKIHTGFSGPGTGVYYEQHIQHFNETVNELLAEKIPSTQ